MLIRYTINIGHFGIGIYKPRRIVFMLIFRSAVDGRPVIVYQGKRNTTRIRRPFGGR